jgi:hypothetical protein
MAAAQCPQAGQQLLHLEWLDQIVLGAGVEALDPIGQRSPGGEQQHRRAQAPGPQPRHEGHALDRRQPPVHDEHVVLPGQAAVQARPPVLGQVDPVAGPRQQVHQQRPELPVILDQQQRRHRRPRRLVGHRRIVARALQTFSQNWPAPSGCPIQVP